MVFRMFLSTTSQPNPEGNSDAFHCRGKHAAKDSLVAFIYFNFMYSVGSFQFDVDGGGAAFPLQPLPTPPLPGGQRNFTIAANETHPRLEENPYWLSTKLPYDLMMHAIPVKPPRAGLHNRSLPAHSRRLDTHMASSTTSSVVIPK